ncbi:hypothetical protein ABT294_00530 [Nonomuraea sp. NPDC000554]|uniref:hypothetical protein n=1 Tax=Nonomuraea sp. NPDC000554 TaxID=3154259 RepID=UPI0033273349
MATLRSVSSIVGATPVFTCPRPAGAVQGDVLVAFQAVGDDEPGGMATPTGGSAWLPLGQRSANEWAGGRVWWKVAGQSEPASYSFRGERAGSIVAIVCVSDSDGTAPLIASVQEDGGDRIVCPTVSPSTTTGVTIRWAAAVRSGATSWSPPPGHTEQMDRDGNGIAAALATRARTIAGSTGSAAFTVVGDLFEPYVIAFTVDVGGTGSPPVPDPDPIPPSPDVHYKYNFCDLKTDDFITNLDLDNVSYTRLIGEPGSFTATVDVTSPEIADAVARVVPRWVEHPSEPDSLSTGPGRSVVHVYRNGVVWGTYAIWKAVVQGDGRGALKVTLTGASLESYLNAVEIRSTLTYSDTDQLDIARDLIASMQELTHANIGLTVQAGASGVLRDRTYAAGEGGTFGQRLKELGDVENGFEWMIHTSDPGTGARVREVRFGYPRLGVAADHVFQQPGNVLSFSQEIDALRGATSYRARGESVSSDASTASTPLMSAEANADQHLSAGWPRIDRTLDYSTVKEVDTLNAYAQRYATERPGAVRVHQISVRLDDTEWTPANLGDTVRIMLANDWWPITGGGASFDHRWRVIGVQVRATSRNSAEVATFTFQEEVDP